MLKKIRERFFKRNIESYEIDMQELLSKQKNGAVIIDVRSLQEYNEGHLKGAINIPYYEINQNVDKILKNREKEIVLYCQAGVRGKQAYKKLIKYNYKKVYNLYKGLENWE